MTPNRTATIAASFGLAALAVAAATGNPSDAPRSWDPGPTVVGAPFSFDGPAAADPGARRSQ